MLYIKICGCILVVLCGIALGLYKAKKCEKRAIDLENIISGMKILCERIRYGGGEISLICEYAFCGCAAIDLHGNTPKPISEFLVKEDYSLLEEFFLNLGNMDTEEECSRTEMYIALLENRYKTIRDETAITARLWRTLGFCGGVAGGLFLM